jgi:hypothetical protein
MHRHSRTESDAERVCELCQHDYTLAAFESAAVQLGYVALTMPKALAIRGADVEFLDMVEIAQDSIDQIREAIEFAPRVGE